MSAYLMFNVSDFTDSAKMEEYRRRVFKTVEKYQGRYLIIGGEQDVLEGDLEPNFLVLIEFESSEQAKRWYQSKEYGEIIDLRRESTEGTLVLIDGYQPVRS